ncbi:LOW QUALITY PROTEIN: probable serine/threonine-protein kinase PIX13 [Brassica napus]|uniref:LOW QUALITY PROTEIN: probable serine/threonine-protein kinase PIX13 n=1 Tax=Brassica napus TaxID=3708 RepID=UPI002078E470|nr:LOW QUALITY PROTEIN: probable serine/threonine-protein kinase PIX13 [Brassica napus]
MGNCLSASKEQLDPISAEERVKVFTVAELKKATNDFRKEMVIGDSFGSHVRGYINPKTLSPAKEGVGMAVAVKRCYMFKDLDQDLQDWLIDLEFLRRNSHNPSLVKLIGYGSDHRTLFIVAEYFPNGSLKNYIYRENRPKSLPWETRLNISIGVAQCLAFLHSWKKTSLSRRYITASKILLDLEFNARVSYFGLENLPYCEEGTHVPSLDYAPPEYILSGKLDMSGDVYSFGAILLQMLTGLKMRRIILEIRNDNESIAKMIDPDLENSYPIQEGIRMCEIIKQCLEEDPKNRPSMQQVLDNLNAIART